MSNVDWKEILEVINGNAEETVRKKVSSWIEEDDSHRRIFNDAVSYEKSLESGNFDYPKRKSRHSAENIFRAGNMSERHKTKFIYFSILAAAAAVTAIAYVLFSGGQHDTRMSIPEMEKTASVTDMTESVLIGNDGHVIPVVHSVSTYSPMESFRYENGILEMNGRLNKKDAYLLKVPHGKIMKLRLPDGSLVSLGGGSSLLWTGNYDRKERNVRLTGDALFDVCKSPEGSVFSVEANNVSICVRGTEFYIDSQTENIVKTCLFSGSVEVSYGKHKTVMKPSEVLVCNLKEGTLSNEKVNDISIYRSRVSGDIRFENERTVCLMDLLERRFGVSFVFVNDSLKDKKISCNFKSGYGIDDIVSILGKTGHMRISKIREGVYAVDGESD